MVCLVVMNLALAIFVNYCYAEAISIGDENVWIVITATGNGGKFSVPVIITDPKGRRMGYDPRTDKWIIEFDAGYDRTGETLEDWTRETEQRYKTDPEYRALYDKGTDLKFDIAFNLIPGDYTIEAIGEGLTKYNFFVLITHRIKGQPEKLADLNFDGVIDKGLTSKFKFTYNSAPDAKKPGVGVRIATSSNLKQDITLSRKIGWIDNDGIMNSLLKKVEAIEASIAKGDKETEKNQLNALINEVNAQKDKHISSKAVKIILEDVDYILNQI